MNLTYGIKRLLSVLAAISIALCCLPLSAAAETEWNNYGNIKWSVEYDSYLEGYLLTISPINETAAIPDFESYGDNVSPWDNYCSSVVNIKIESGITRIGNYAFYWFSQIKNINNVSYYYYVRIPNTVTSIGNYAFSRCRQLDNVELGNNIKTIGNGAFSYCSNLYSVCLPTNLYAIDGTSEGEIPDSLFSGCSNLSKVTMQQNKTVNFVLPGRIKKIGKFAFSGCKKLHATNNDKFRVPNTVVTIDDYAFNNCSSIDIIEVTNGTHYISASAFNGCTSLKEIFIIYGRNSDYFYVPEYYSVYDGPELYNKAQTKFIRLMPAYPETEYTVLEMADEIGDYAFYSSVNLEKITLGAGVKEIGRYVFGDCNSLLNIEVSAANQYYKSVDGVLYSKDGKTLIAYPGGRTEKSFKIPDGVTAIAEGALDCLSLTELYIPKSVTEMPFLSYNIKNIYYSGTETDFNSIKFFIPYGATVGYNAKPNEKYDINCDDKINILDIIGIKKAISAGETKTYQSDINSDGLLNAEDVAALKKRLLNY